MKMDSQQTTKMEEKKMSGSEEQFDIIDLAAFQYRAMVRLLGTAIESADAEYFKALPLPPELEKAILPLIGRGSAGAGYSCNFSDALERYWDLLPVNGGLRPRLQEIASLSDPNAWKWDERYEYIRRWDAMGPEMLEKVSDLTTVAKSLHRRR